MEKQRKWQLFLIFTVLALTIYNILPTIFYYSKPLKSTINPNQGKEIAASIERNVNQLESDTKDWIASFCELLQLKPLSIVSDAQFVTVRFAKAEDASRFRQFLPRAGSLISFAPAQLRLASAPEDGSSNEVVVQRRIPIRLDSNRSLFSFVSKKEADGTRSPEYREIILDRAAQIALALSGPTE